jgi:tetratricopeptide (TPR) repeat protein
LGSACGYAGRAEELEDAFDRALQLAVTPWDESMIWYARGNAENNAFAWDAALRSFARLAELEPDWINVWLLRGMVLGNIGNVRGPRYHEEALVALDRALQSPELSLRDERVIYDLKYKSLWSLGREQEAEVFLRKSEELRRKERAATRRRPRIH